MGTEEKPFTLDLSALDTYTLIKLFINFLSLQAWQHMGLRVKPGKDHVEKDLELAKTAIDCIIFLIDKVKTHLLESEKKQLQNLLADLQINFVKIAEE